MDNFENYNNGEDTKVMRGTVLSDCSDIYRVIEDVTLGKLKNFDIIKSLQKIHSYNISTTFSKNKLTIFFIGFDGRNYMLQTRAETGLMPNACYEVNSVGNKFCHNSILGEAIDQNKDKAMSLAYSKVVYKPVQELFEKLFGYKPYVVRNNYACGGRIYGDSVGLNNFQPKITDYKAVKNKFGDWHVTYEAEISFSYDVGTWRKPKEGDTFEDELKNFWEYRNDGYWYIIGTDVLKNDKRKFVSPTVTPYLLSELASQIYSAE